MFTMVGSMQYITDADIDKLIELGAITAPEDFEAYKNNKNLIESIGHKDAGTYDDWLYSDQIAASSSEDSFNPNNLGYDIYLTAGIDKAKIDIDLGTVDRTYGNSTITGTTGDIQNNGYGFTIDISNGAFTDEMEDELTSGNIGFKVTGDGALTGSSTGRVTNDVRDDYNWSGEFTLTEELAKNYDFNVTTENEKFVDGKFVVTGVNNSHVNKA